MSFSSGQIIVEYLLLLIIASGLALVITSTIVSRNSDNPGFLIARWAQIIKLIGIDPTDEPRTPSTTEGQ